MLRVISSKRKRVPFNVQRVFVGPGPSRSRISRIHIVQYMCVLKGCSTEETVVKNWNVRPYGRSRSSVAQLRARTIWVAEEATESCQGRESKAADEGKVL